MPNDENRLIINMGNIPSKAEVIFISEFIHSIEASQKYEFEFFRNLPIFQGKDSEIYENSEVKGKINIITKNEILNVEKNILMKNLEIIEEKSQNEKKNDYVIIYQIKELPSFSWYNLDYIPSSKIYFDFNMSEPFAYAQESLLNNNEINYFIQYKYKKENSSNKNERANPALFIFLVDQSGSMEGERIEIASKALQLFIQSLPVGSYYQIIGFGSDFKKYDITPKKYDKENIKKSMNVIENLYADLGGTNVAKPLKDIYSSNKIYDKINLPKNIFLLTDGAAWDKNEALELIEKNSSKYTVYSIGIGEDFDDDLIKNAGILGKGNYNFCKNLNNLNSIIVSEINKATSPYISNIKYSSNLDKNIIIKNNTIPNIIRDNGIINLYYIKEKKNYQVKIKLELRYLDYESNKNIKKIYEIIPEKIEKGEDLSKLIINNYILTNNDLSEEEILKLALKYQICSKNTSLFAEVELSEKITKEMKLKIIGDKENNIIKQIKKEKIQDIQSNNDFCFSPILEYSEKYSFKCSNFDDNYIRLEECPILSGFPENYEFLKCECECDYKSFNNIKNETINCKKLSFGNKKRGRPVLKVKECKKNKINKSNENKEKNKIELNNKENIMKMIKTQDFIEGYWDENEYTKIIKKKYKKEFNLFKKLKKKNLNDKIILTILVIYFINKEHTELLSDLIMVIKKGKIYIQNETKNNYEDLIKEIGLN